MNAARIASRALESLSITPASASGVNIRYRFDALPDGFIAALASQIDDRLADTHRTIVRRQLRRSIAWEAGALNIEVIENEDASGLLSFNFHWDSAAAADHIGWLNMTAQMLTDAETLTTTPQNLE
jgi:hypothetical protein